MKRGLILNAISPRIGGVLIRGERGTAKSTAARALAALLPEIDVVADCPFGCDPYSESALCDNCVSRKERGEELPVARRRIRMVELPVSATEDRVVGTLDIEKAIKHGEKHFEPGVLAAANRGLLYVDEVNLLDDHVVDLLLDSAAMGVNVVEREGISFSHPAQFILVGTMNPEEGDLRPQLLDRFGLSVDIRGIGDAEARVQIVQRRIEYEQNPDLFYDAWQEEEEHLSQRIQRARALLPRVRYLPHHLHLIARLATDLGVDGHRADIIILKAALAHAAFEGRKAIQEQDILLASELALFHRLQRRPLQEVQQELDTLPQRLERVQAEMLLQQGGQGAAPEENDLKKNTSEDLTSSATSDEGETESQQSESPAPQPFPQPQNPGDDNSRSSSHQQPVAIGDLVETPRVQTNLDRLTRRNAGKRSATRTDRKRGRYSQSRPANGDYHDIAFDATFRQAAPQQIHRADDGLALSIRTDELQRKVRTRRTANLLLFCVDASWSMAASERMEQTKGAILSLLIDAYQKRDQVSMVTFQKEESRLILPPTNSVDLARRALENIPVGGKTPLSGGMYLAHEVIIRELHRDAEIMPLFVLLTDGAGNVSMGSLPPQEEANRVARLFQKDHIRSVVINTEHEAFDRGLASQLAGHLGADCYTLADFRPETLVRHVRKELSER